jgi:hypothetical protein
MWYNYPEYLESGVAGPYPTEWFGVDAVDGDAGDWIAVGTGSRYMTRDLANDLTQLPLQKVKNESLDSDYTGWQVICETVLRADFTDGGSTSGTYVMKQTIPAGAWVLRTILQDLTGFTGDTSAALIVGDGTDTDRYNTGTPSVFTTAVAVDMAAPSGTQIHVTAKSVTLTITSAADFTNVTAGQLTVKIIYFV